VRAQDEISPHPARSRQAGRPASSPLTDPQSGLRPWRFSSARLPRCAAVSRNVAHPSPRPGHRQAGLCPKHDLVRPLWSDRRRLAIAAQVTAPRPQMLPLWRAGEGDWTCAGPATGSSRSGAYGRETQKKQEKTKKKKKKKKQTKIQFPTPQLKNLYRQCAGRAGAASGSSPPSPRRAPHRCTGPASACSPNRTTRGSCTATDPRVQTSSRPCKTR